MASVPASTGEKPPRKKVRKGTFSCWECKRRKVRCVFRSESDATCTGCSSRGIECLSQKFVDQDVAAGATRSIPDRVGRLESLMETCIQNLMEVRQNRNDASFDVLTPSSSTAPNVHETAPVLSLFNNDLLDQNHTGEDLSNRGLSTLRCNTKPNAGNFSSKAQKIRQTLLALLPSQLQLESIVKSTGDWWRPWQYFYPDICAQGETSSLAEFTSRARSETHLPAIANVLLCIAISIQQLPTTFDFSSIQMCYSAKELVAEYTSTVTSLVTSDDEITTSVEGLECLVLLGKIYLNACKPRMAWLSFRRAMNMAEIIGLHGKAARSIVGSDGISKSRKTSVWWQIYQADRLLSLLLGFSCGLRDDFCDLDVCDDETEKAYIRNIAKIASRVSDRNLTMGGPSFALTQELEESIRILAMHMPQSWWSLPPVSSDMDEAALLGHIMPQFWHYQVEILLHLPFMLRAANDPKFEYNKHMCLRASRAMIERFIFLRNSACAMFITCKMVEFQSFIAALVLQLNLLSQTANKYSRDDPRQALDDKETVDSVMEELARRPSDGTGVAPQAVKALETLKAVARNDGSIGDRFKLNIPYFGTISIRRGVNLQHAEPNRSMSSGLPLADTLQQSNLSNGQPGLFMPSLMHDVPASQVDSLEWPQIYFTSSLFTNFSASTAQLPEDDWSYPGLDAQFDNSQIADLNGTLDWFGENSYSPV